MRAYAESSASRIDSGGNRAGTRRRIYRPSVSSCWTSTPRLIEEAASRGVEVLCLQELFTSPYFPAEQHDRWRQLAEQVPDGPTVRMMQDLARKHRMIMVVPVFEEEITGLFYNNCRSSGLRRGVPGQVSQEPPSPRRAGFLGEVLLSSRQPGLSRIRHHLRQSGSLHLLRPPLSRGAPGPLVWLGPR